MHDDAAIPHLKKAIELDPNFAMAYATLGVALSNIGRTSEGSAALKKAYELRDRASEREKLYIQAHYYDEVTVDNENPRRLCRMATDFPRDTVPYDNAALLQQLSASMRKLSSLPVKLTAWIRRISMHTTIWRVRMKR